MSTTLDKNLTFGRMLVEGKDEWMNIQDVVRSSFLLVKDTLLHEKDRSDRLEKVVNKLEDYIQNLTRNFEKTQSQCTLLENKLVNTTKAMFTKTKELDIKLARISSDSKKSEQDIIHQVSEKMNRSDCFYELDKRPTMEIMVSMIEGKINKSFYEMEKKVNENNELLLRVVATEDFREAKNYCDQLQEFINNVDEKFKQMNICQEKERKELDEKYDKNQIQWQEVIDEKEKKIDEIQEKINQLIQHTENLSQERKQEQIDIQKEMNEKLSYEKQLYIEGINDLQESQKEKDGMILHNFQEVEKQIVYLQEKIKHQMEEDQIGPMVQQKVKDMFSFDSHSVTKSAPISQQQIQTQCKQENEEAQVEKQKMLLVSSFTPRKEEKERKLTFMGTLPFSPKQKQPDNEEIISFAHSPRPPQPINSAFSSTANETSMKTFLPQISSLAKLQKIQSQSSLYANTKKKKLSLPYISSPTSEFSSSPKKKKITEIVVNSPRKQLEESLKQASKKQQKNMTISSLISQHQKNPLPSSTPSKTKSITYPKRRSSLDLFMESHNELENQLNHSTASTKYSRSETKRKEQKNEVYKEQKPNYPPKSETKTMTPTSSKERLESMKQRHQQRLQLMKQKLNEK